MEPNEKMTRVTTWLLICYRTVDVILQGNAKHVCGR